MLAAQQPCCSHPAPTAGAIIPANSHCGPPPCAPPPLVHRYVSVAPASHPSPPQPAVCQCTLSPCSPYWPTSGCIQKQTPATAQTHTSKRTSTHTSTWPRQIQLRRHCLPACLHPRSHYRRCGLDLQTNATHTAACTQDCSWLQDETACLQCLSMPPVPSPGLTHPFCTYLHVAAASYGILWLRQPLML